MKTLRHLAAASALLASSPALAEKPMSEVTLEAGAFVGQERNDFFTNGFFKPEYRRWLNEAFGAYGQMDFKVGPHLEKENIGFRFDAEMINGDEKVQLNSLSLTQYFDFGGKVFGTVGAGFDYQFHQAEEMSGPRIVALAGMGVQVKPVVIRAGFDVNFPFSGDINPRTYWTPQFSVGIPLALTKSEAGPEIENEIVLDISETEMHEAPRKKALRSLSDVSEEIAKEYDRLEDEMQNRASGNQWDGVEASYSEILDLKVEAEYAVYMTATQSALNFGNIEEAKDRAERAQLADPEAEEPRLLLEDIQKNYRYVSIDKNGRNGDVQLEVSHVPFNPFQRAAIQFAQEVLSKKNSFRGHLPIGDYLLGGQSFSLVEAETQVEIQVR